MDLITRAIENNIVDWNPVIIADTSGVTEVGGFNIADIRRILSGSGTDEPPDDDEKKKTENESVPNEALTVIILLLGGILGAIVFRHFRK